jgi:hypothetical protein
MANKITFRQMKYAASVAGGASPREAAIEAGYSAKAARTQGYKLLKDPKVQAYLSELRKSIRESAGYGVEQAMAELDECMKFSVSTKNATALARCVELRAKLHGLMDTTKAGGDTASFIISINGLREPLGSGTPQASITAGNTPMSYESLSSLGPHE